MRGRRRLLIAVGLVAIISASTQPAVAESYDPGWVTAWTASPQTTYGETLSNQTLRMVFSARAFGNRARIRLTNRYGTEPVTFADVHIGIRGKGAGIEAGTNRRVRFAGARSVTVAAGADVISDPVRVDVRPFERLAVSIRIDGVTENASMHYSGNQTSYMTPPGSLARGGGEAGAPFTRRTTAVLYLDGIDVRAGKTYGAIGILGDSITDNGVGIGIDRRWPDNVQQRFLQTSQLKGMAVLNAGVGGNRLLTDSPVFGAAGVDRLSTDLLDLSGLRAVVVLLGTNDIAGDPPPRATVDDLIAGYRKLIAQIHAAGLPAYGMTLTPVRFDSPYTWHADAHSRQVRRQTNRWIRKGGEFDDVFDSGAILMDPSGDGQLNKAYASGDGLHLNVFGLEAVAESVKLGELRRRTVPEPVNLSRPRIERSGDRLICRPGAWGPPGGEYRYRWEVRGASVHAQRRIRITPSISGSRIRCRVTAENVAGQSRATSQSELVRSAG